MGNCARDLHTPSIFFLEQDGGSKLEIPAMPDQHMANVPHNAIQEGYENRLEDLDNDEDLPAAAEASQPAIFTQWAQEFSILA